MKRTMTTSRQKEEEEQKGPGRMRMRMRGRSNTNSSTSSSSSSRSTAASPCRRTRGAVLLSLFLAVMVDGFVLRPPPTRMLGACRQPWTETETTRSTPSSSSSSSSSVLMAAGGGSKKKNKKVKKKRPGSGASSATSGGGGFGGAALQICPCGSGSSYNDCCGKIHSDVNIFRRSSPSDVVRARYSAYARRDVDFLIASTHPSHKDWKPSGPQRSSWKETIKTNMYDNFDFNNCIIVKEDINISLVEEEDQKKEEAVVQFIAEMTLSTTGEKTSFMETSTFERSSSSSSDESGGSSGGVDGPWLYREGTIEAAPSSSDSTTSSEDQGEEVVVTSSSDDKNEIPATLLEGLTGGKKS